VAHIPPGHWHWALGSICALHRVPFVSESLAREFPPPHHLRSLPEAAAALGLTLRKLRVKAGRLSRLPLPLIVGLRPLPGVEAGSTEGSNESTHLGIATASDENEVLVFLAGDTQPHAMPLDEFARLATGDAWHAIPASADPKDPDAFLQPGFGFRWFADEMLRHKSLWRDVLLASCALQIIALTTPLFTQAIVDKVVVHRTQSTLIAIGGAMALLLVFSSALTWLRQRLVLYVGNRVDAALGVAVWDHLLRLPLRYFEHRPTGVVCARLQGVDAIREFIAGAAVALVLDLPFLVICLAVMLWYSPMLTAVAAVVLLLIAAGSAAAAPLFQRRLNQQFLLGARNQAFVTEHVAGIETVKSLQLEPLLRQRYGGLLTQYLDANVATRQLANTYNVYAATLEQALTLGILMLGAWMVMTEPAFTVGMLVAFQMLAGRLSQPVLRIVGLWTQFQQAKLSVDRLGDLMNVPPERHTMAPQHAREAGAGRIELKQLAFRHAEDRPLLFERFDLRIEPGEVVAVVGASGAGKSTLAKLLMGFYAPTAGSVRIDGIDTRHAGANELRAAFGVVPQETVLFSGTVLDNVLAAQPAATFEHAVVACKMAGIHTTIEALPQGYQTEIGERGVGLSGGQKQRLAIARALLKRPRVLIFDEATAALDDPTTEAFAQTINTLRGRVTMVFITHRLPKGLKVDRTVRIGASDASQETTCGGEAAPDQPAGRTKT
jgi:ATP-binding cassette, subfamily B, bacterial HlyB/CyaB